MAVTIILKLPKKAVTLLHLHPEAVTIERDQQVWIFLLLPFVLLTCPRKSWQRLQGNRVLHISQTCRNSLPNHHERADLHHPKRRP
jgi:hypothetical protein